MFVEAFIPHLAVETLDVGVLHRLAGFDQRVLCACAVITQPNANTLALLAQVVGGGRCQYAFTVGAERTPDRSTIALASRR
jgi:hypothetical protein